MEIYKIELTETLQRIVEIKAISLNDAIAEVNKKYNNEEIVLDSDDYTDKNINVFNPRY